MTNKDQDDLAEKRRKLRAEAAEWYRANPRATAQPATLAERHVQAIELIAAVLCADYSKDHFGPENVINPGFFRQAACDLIDGRLKIGYAPQEYDSDFDLPAPQEDI